ncbi:hypothetical protein M8494_01800 [Serratia ureilytica]
MIDYRTAACDTLWQLDDKDALDNALYWLRAMDCADRIGSTQARAGENGAWRQLVRRFQTEHPAGQRAADFRRAPPDDRQDQQLPNGFPGSLRPLTQLWRQQQMLQITLFDEKARYQHLQSSDSQIDSLRQSQARLQSQLQDTSRKLENLTDIERQLSRKQLQKSRKTTQARKRAKPPVNGAAAKGGAAGRTGKGHRAAG